MPKFSKKALIIIFILVLVALSQLLMVKFIYAGKLKGGLGYFVANLYNLKAATVLDNKNTYSISLAKYLQHRNFLQRTIDEQKIDPAGIDVAEAAWQRTLEDQWVNNFADEANLSVTEEEISQYMTEVVGVEENSAKAFEKFTQENYDLSWAKFKEMLIEPFLLRDKVYVYLLDNYNDIEGMQAAQNAYDALAGGRDFQDVAEEFATDQTYVASSLWLKAEDLVDFYEPIAQLEAGQHSKIVNIVGGYIIWYVQSIAEEDGNKVWEVKSLFIQAKTLDEFFQDYLKSVTIKKKI